jgi:hypothetical protein
LERAFEKRVHDEVEKRAKKIDDEFARTLALYQEWSADAAKVIKAREGYFTKEEYEAIRMCLHPDRARALGHASLVEKFERAFKLFEDMKLVLLKEVEFPTGDFELKPKNPRRAA